MVNTILEILGFALVVAAAATVDVSLALLVAGVGLILAAAVRERR